MVLLSEARELVDKILDTYERFRESGYNDFYGVVSNVPRTFKKESDDHEYPMTPEIIFNIVKIKFPMHEYKFIYRNPFKDNCYEGDDVILLSPVKLSQSEIEDLSETYYVVNESHDINWLEYEIKDGYLDYEIYDAFK